MQKWREYREFGEENMTMQLHGSMWARVAVLLALGISTQGEGAAAYRNPIIEGNLADPAVILHEGVYHLYATGEVNGDNGYRW